MAWRGAQKPTSPSPLSLQDVLYSQSFPACSLPPPHLPFGLSSVMHVIVTMLSVQEGSGGWRESGAGPVDALGSGLDGSARGSLSFPSPFQARSCRGQRGCRTRTDALQPASGQRVSAVPSFREKRSLGVGTLGDTGSDSEKPLGL